MAGPGYTYADLIFYTGLIGGIIIGYLTTGYFGAHPLVRLGVGLVVGLGCGWFGLKLYEGVSGRPGE